jgi:uncharacterized protein YecT (DUF1311 family)
VLRFPRLILTAPVIGVAGVGVRGMQLLEDHCEDPRQWQAALPREYQFPNAFDTLMNAGRLIAESILCLSLTRPTFSHQVSDQEAPYSASQAEVDNALRDCQKDEVAITICQWSAYRESLIELRSVEKEVARALSSEKFRLAYFKRSQEAWEQFRNADCDLDASPADGGSMTAGLIYSCKAILNRRRAELLRHFVGILDAGSPQPLLLYERQ